MSIQAVAWVLEHSTARGIDRLVLISLANHANAHHECWPSQRKVATEAGVSPSTVAVSIQRLVELGELTLVTTGGPRTSARYRLAIDPDLGARDTSAADNDPTDLSARLPSAARDSQCIQAPDLHERDGESGSARLPSAAREHRANSAHEPSAARASRAQRAPQGRAQRAPQGRAEPSRTIMNLTDAAPADAAAPAPTGRPPDPLWDAFAAELGYQPASPTERGKWNRALKNLRSVEPPVTATDVHARVAAYRRRWPGIDCNPAAVVAHWGELTSDRPAAPPPPPAAPPDCDHPDCRSGFVPLDTETVTPCPTCNPARQEVHAR